MPKQVSKKVSFLSSKKRLLKLRLPEIEARSKLFLNSPIIRAATREEGLLKKRAQRGTPQAQKNLEHLRMLVDNLHRKAMKGTLGKSEYLALQQYLKAMQKMK
ncbi:MAG: hypothetical protein WC821_05080 [archaeon]|jgi:hypothetical protein